MVTLRVSLPTFTFLWSYWVILLSTTPIIVVTSFTPLHILHPPSSSTLLPPHLIKSHYHHEHPHPPKQSHSHLDMVGGGGGGGAGGKGWENNHYLESLGGDENDREEETKKYSQFQQSRNQFLKRQEKAMQDPKVRQFMQARQQQQQQMQQQGDDFGMGLEGMGDPFMEELTGGGAGAGGRGGQGGTRFQSMMNRSRRMQQLQQQQEEEGFLFGMQMQQQEGETENDE